MVSITFMVGITFMVFITFMGDTGLKRCASQTEAFDYLYRPSTSSSQDALPLSDAACQTEEFEYLFSNCSIADSKPFDKEYFRNDDDKVSFYTGLPAFDTLELVYNFISPHIIRRTQSLSLFQEMVMVLIKLRLDVPFQDLAYRFGVSKSNFQFPIYFARKNLNIIYIQTYI